jgi:hypothetical protein
VEQPAEPIPPVHTVPIPADDGRIGRWIGRLQTKRSVGAVGVVVRNVDPQDLRQMTATDDQQPVQALGAHRPNPALRVDVRVGCLHRRQQQLGARRIEHVVEAAAELRVTIADEEAHPASWFPEHQ